MTDRARPVFPDMDQGFSLLVVVIALGMFAVGLLAVVSLVPASRESVRRTVSAARAAAIAERELARIRTFYGCPESPPPKFLEGSEPGGYRWDVRIEGDEDIYTVTLTVYWRDEGRENSEVFVTRFVPR